MRNVDNVNAKDLEGIFKVTVLLLLVHFYKCKIIFNVPKRKVLVYGMSCHGIIHFSIRIYLGMFLCK